MRAQGIVLGKKTPTYRKPTALPRDLNHTIYDPFVEQMGKMGKRVSEIRLVHSIKHGFNKRCCHPHIMMTSKEHRGYFRPQNIDTFPIKKPWLPISHFGNWKPLQFQNQYNSKAGITYKGVGRGGI